MTDNEFLLDILKDHSWHSTAELLAYSIHERGCGLTVHSRISDLRDPDKYGLNIEYRRVPGFRAQAHQYRLVALRESEEVLSNGDSVDPPTLGTSSIRRRSFTSEAGLGPSSPREDPSQGQLLIWGTAA